MQELLRMHLSNSVSDEFSVTYLATGLSQHAPQPEETEQLLIKKIPFAQAVEHVLDGTITDSISVAAILKVRLLLDKGLLDKRSEEHTSELQSLMRISYAVFCLKKKIHTNKQHTKQNQREQYMTENNHYT